VEGVYKYFGTKSFKKNGREEEKFKAFLTF
jgi:hypothetical protein